MAAWDLAERERVQLRFERLMAELEAGNSTRNSFEAWEIAVIMDFGECALAPQRRGELLRQYARAVTRQLETGPGPPMKLSEFLRRRAERRGDVIPEEAVPDAPRSGISPPGRCG